MTFVLAALAIRFQPHIEHLIRHIGPRVAIPLATALFAIVASAPFSVTDALAVMNGALFGPFWGSIIDVVGLVIAGVLGYWIAIHATHGLDLQKMYEKLPPWVRRFKPGSPMFLITVRIIPGFGGTMSTATAANLRVPVWIHVVSMCAVAVPVCVLFTVFGDRAVQWVHGYEHRARMYILHHRPHLHFRRRHAEPTLPPTAGPQP